MAYPIPFRSRLKLSLRVFNHRESQLQSPVVCSPLLHFNATSAFSPTVRRGPTGTARSRAPLSNHSSRKLSGPSACSTARTLFVDGSFDPTSENRCPGSRKPLSPGFGYPLEVVTILAALKACFSSQRSRASPFRALLLPGGRSGSSLPAFAPAISCKTLSNLAASLQRLDPTWKAVPHSFAPRIFTPGQGLMLSWAFRPLGLSLGTSLAGVFSPLGLPFRPSATSPFRERHS